ncbi:MAG: hypothetical protein HYT36_01375 [Candidatus Staskawiczbacteria bacterium]|nr:hypothetical protein [Candidatus Staskawiczbacteria bacterium]
MGKDLQKLRETDALKEREAIIKIKTPEEEREKKLPADQQKEQAEESAGQLAEKTGRERILQKKSEEEKEAELSLKKYATEPEKQQIFLYETQRIDLEDQVRKIEEEKEPALKLEKNRVLLEKGEWEKKLSKVSEEEESFQTEQKFISGKEKESNIAKEKQGMEKRRWELEKEVKNAEKKRWEVEREVAKTESKIKKIDEDYEKIVAEKNNLAKRKADIDKIIREIYSKIITNVEAEKAKKEREKRLAQGKIAEIKSGEKEEIQRQQWKGMPEKYEKYETGGKEKQFLKDMPVSAREKIFGQAEEEEKARKKFLEDVEKWAKEKE